MKAVEVLPQVPAHGGSAAAAKLEIVSVRSRGVRVPDEADLADRLASPLAGGDTLRNSPDARLISWGHTIAVELEPVENFGLTQSTGSRCSRLGAA